MWRYDSWSTTVSTQNQAECKQAALKQASVRERTLITVCRSFSSTTESFLLLLLLLPHQNVSEMQRKQVGSLTLGALTLSLVLSLHAATPAPRRKRILHFHWHPPSPSFSAASCFRGRGLVHQQQGSVSIEQQVRARWLPKTDRGGPVLAIVLTGSSP